MLQLSKKKFLTPKDRNNSVQHASSKNAPFSVLAEAKKSTSIDAETVKKALSTYNPDHLTAPFVDETGTPIIIQSVNYLQLSKKQRDQVKEIFSDYAKHKRDLQDLAEVKIISPEDVPPHDADLHGQEGVFAKKAIEEDSVICLFDGCILTDPEDIQKDKEIRQNVGVDNYYQIKINSEQSKQVVLEAMGISMKINTIKSDDRFGDQFFGNLPKYLSDLPRLNLKMQKIEITGKKTNGDTVKFSPYAVVANCTIKEKDQLLFYYKMNASR